MPRIKGSVGRSWCCQSIDRNIVDRMVTSWSQTKSDRLVNLPQVVENNGEPSRARTCDPLIKSQLLYQLSYRPIRERKKLYVRSVECQAGEVLDNKCCPKTSRTTCSQRRTGSPPVTSVPRRSVRQYPASPHTPRLPPRSLRGDEARRRRRCRRCTAHPA